MKTHLFLALLLICSGILVPANAQSFDLRMVKISGDNTEMIATVQLKSRGGTFDLGSSVLFFDYDPAVLGAPSVLESLNYFGLITDPALCPSGFCVYSPTHVLSNTPGRTGITISLAFPNNGALLDTSYVNVLRLRFPVLNPAGNVAVTWRGTRITGELISPTAVRMDDEISMVPENNLIGINGIPLPVSLLYFKGQPDKERISLSWATSLEVNNMGFVVQRRKPGGDFKELGFVEGAGNSNEALSYTFEDTEVAAGQAYQYRLMQMDLDGYGNYSEVIELIIQADDMLQVGNLYPNPVQDQLFAELVLKEESLASVSMINTHGQLLMRNELMLSAGEHRLEFDMSRYVTGIYYLLIETEDAVVRKKVFRQ